MRLIFAEKAWEDYLYWQKTDKKMLNRINGSSSKILGETHLMVLASPSRSSTPSLDIGLRRINDEHRIVYKIHQDSILVAQLRYHY